MTRQEKHQKAKNARRSRLRSLVNDYKAAQGCIDCGETDYIVLDLDHRDRADKFKEISKMVSTCRGPDAIMTEILKCDVRCANCHRRKTHAKKDYSRLV